MRGWYSIGLSVLLVASAGCGGYTAKFQIQQIVNAPDDERSRKQLDIDIVCLDKKLAEKHPRIANGSMRSDEWFKLRAERGTMIAEFPGGAIYSLRGTGTAYANYTADTHKGPPLTSPADGGRNEVDVPFTFSRYGESGAVILVFGRFHDGKGGLLPTDPVRIAPPPSWNTKLLIDVGRRSLAYKGAK